MPTQKLCSAVTRHADKLGHRKGEHLFSIMQEKRKKYCF